MSSLDLLVMMRTLTSPRDIFSSMTMPICSFSKPGALINTGYKICQVVHDLAAGEEPDNNFKKPIIGAKYLIPLKMKITR